MLRKRCTRHCCAEWRATCARCLPTDAEVRQDDLVTAAFRHHLNRYPNNAWWWHRRVLRAVAPEPASLITIQDSLRQSDQFIFADTKRYVGDLVASGALREVDGAYSVGDF